MSTVPPNDRDEAAPRPMTTRPRDGLSGLLEPMILTWRLFWDGRVGVLPKLIPLAAVVYLLSPFDFMPELVLPFVGLIDDVGVVLLAMNGFVALCPPGVVQAHRQQLGYASSAGADRDADVVDGYAEPIDDR